MRTRSFPGVKEMGHGIDQPHTSSTKVNEGRAIQPLPLWVFADCSRVNFTLQLYCTQCIEIYTGKIIHILTLPSFLVGNFMLPSCRSNFATVDDTT
jgi:hypothetical protein